MGARAQQTTPFPASMNLSSLTGIDGFVLNGEQAYDYYGGSVASAGDVNELEIPPRGNSKAKTPAKIYLAGYDRFPWKGIILIRMRGKGVRK